MILKFVTYFQQLFHTPGLGFSSDVVYISADEVSIASILNETVEKFPTVTFGSYPKLFHRLVNIALTLFSGYYKAKESPLENCNVYQYFYKYLLILLIFPQLLQDQNYSRVPQPLGCICCQGILAEQTP